MSGTNWKKDLSAYLTPRINEALAPVDPFLPLEEIRIRAMQPLQLVFSGYERMIAGPGNSPIATEKDISAVVARVCEQSVYAWEAELKSGFVTLPGGYRVGVTGKCVMENDSLHHIADITSVNVRITRQCAGVAAPYVPLLFDSDGGALSTLVVSPPGCGKTTFLRDLARICSDGKHGARPMKVAIVDTRYEIAGCVRGAPQYDVGSRTDVRSGGKKADGIRAMLLTMSPEVIVTDEIGACSEALAVMDARNSGVSVLASAHAPALAELAMRPVMAALLRERTFARYVLLGRSRGVGTVEAIFDARGERMKLGEQVWQKQLRS